MLFVACGEAALDSGVDRLPTEGDWEFCERARGDSDAGDEHCGSSDLFLLTPTALDFLGAPCTLSGSALTCWQSVGNEATYYDRYAPWQIGDFTTSIVGYFPDPESFKGYVDVAVTWSPYDDTWAGSSLEHYEVTATFVGN